MCVCVGGGGGLYPPQPPCSAARFRGPCVKALYLRWGGGVEEVLKVYRVLQALSIKRPISKPGESADVCLHKNANKGALH